MFRSSAQEERQNEEIDKMIRRDKKALAHQVKILLLGWCTEGLL